MTTVCMSPAPTTEPWYRQFWPWFLIGPPLVAVILGIITIVLATNGQDALVVDDYAKIGRVYEMQVERDRRAAAMGVEARVAWDHEAGAISAVLNLPAVPGEDLVLRIVHPTRADLDRLVMLQPAITGVYRGYLPAGDDSGRRYLQLESPTGGWRLTGELQEGSGEIVLAPQTP